MMNKLLSFLGLCRRAGKMSLGYDVVRDSIANGEARIIIVSNDISEHTLKNVVNAADRFNKKVYKLSADKEALSTAIGKYSAVISINDSGFSKKLLALMAENNNQLGEECHL